MRTVLVLSLAACWSTSKPAENKPVVAQKITPVEKAVEKAPTPTPAPEKPPYVLPKRVRDALANESLAGNALVPAVYNLHPSAAAARADATQPRGGKPIAMQVIKDHGDVVELSTAGVNDCTDTYDQPYQLTVFVKRDKLIPRSKVDVTKAFRDGTAVAIDRGAPVDTSAGGLGWSMYGFTETKVLPIEDQLTYAVVPARQPTATLPKLASERLVCDRDKPPVTLAEWQAAQRGEREAKAREQQEARRAEMERRRIELERRRPEIEREQKARAERERKECEKRERAREAKAKRAPKKHGPRTAREQALEEAMNVGVLGKMSTCGMASVFGSVGLGGDFDTGQDLVGGVGTGWRSYDPMSMYVPYCSVQDPSSNAGYGEKAPKVAPPTVDGNAVPWPSYDRTPNDHVVKHGAYFLADIERRCGRMRIAVEGASVRRGGGGGMGMIGGGAQVQVWIPKAGPVTWPDGTPAGKYTGSKQYQTVVENGDRICVRVSGIAELVCHDKKTATTGMASRYRVD